MEEKKLNPLELFLMFLLFRSMCLAIALKTWFKKMDTALGALLHKNWKWFDYFLDTPFAKNLTVGLGVLALLLAFATALIFGNETLTNWFWENAFSQPWWPKHEMP